MNISLFRDIPKIIHYVWVGGIELDTISIECMDSWRIMHSWRIMRWDETNIDFEKPYLKKARAAAKWANISNLQRLLAVYKYGGVYLDTDVQLVKPLDSLRHNNRCFFGRQLDYHESHWVNNAIFGAVRGHWFVKAAINRLIMSFDGTESSDLSSPVLITSLLKEYGLADVNTDGIIKIRDLVIYPKEYFYPYNWEKQYDKIYIKDETIAVHHWSKRW